MAYRLVAVCERVVRGTNPTEKSAENVDGD